MLCNACHIVHAIIPISNNGQHQQLHNISLNQESINLPNLECMRPWVQLQTGCRRCMWSLFKNTCNMLQLYFMAKCNESLKPKAKGEQSKSTCLLHQVPSERLQRLSRKKHWIISTQLYVFWSQFCVWFHLKLFFWAWDLSPVRRSFHVVVFFFYCYTSFSHVCLHLPCFLVRARYCIRSQVLTVKSLPWTENIFI